MNAETQNKPTFVDPYYPDGITFEKGEHGRIQCDIPKEVHRKFYIVLPDRSDAVFQRTFAILTQKLITALDQHGITDCTHADEYKSFITNLKLVDGRDLRKRRTPSRALPKAGSPDDSRGTKGTSGENPTT